MICVPKEEGGLGVINIEIQNQSLLMKKPGQVLQQEKHPLGQFDLGEALQKWKTAKPCQEGIFLVERCADVALKIQRPGIHSS
jgi:hypothetical protein